MDEKDWIRLDNASNIFLAARNEIDTKVFRLSVEMTEPVNPRFLQKALNQVYEEYPLFHSTLRRGYFWYYLEPNDVNPRVKYESEVPVAAIYKSGKADFLFKVLYREHFIHLEVFHALTDGTGALWFLEDLVTEYIRLRYLAKQEDELPLTSREKENLEDSFNRYFKEKDKRKLLTRLTKPLKSFYEGQKEPSDVIPRPIENQLEEKVYQVKGTSTPDNRPRIVHANLALDEVLQLSRAEGVSLTMYLTALYILAVYETIEEKEKDKDQTLSVSIPINLRQFFPSITVRNFFSTTKVSYTFEAGKKPDLSEICQEINQQFRETLEKDALESRLKKLIEYEFNPVARIVLRPIKDLALNLINRLNNRKITVAMSNLGSASLPDVIGDYVEHFYFMTSVIRPQFCMISYKNKLNLSFISPFVENEITQNVVRFLADQGVDVTIDANRVTKEELNHS